MMKMKTKLAGVLTGVGLLIAVPAFAHHSFAAEFDSAKPITLTGVVTRLQWTNPHIYFYVNVKDERGAATEWAFEGGAPNALFRAGWKRDSLKPGDEVTVNGYLAKNGSKTVNTRSVKLADGRTVFAGSSAPS